MKIADPTGASDIYVLPAVNENEPLSEPYGYFVSPFPWNSPPVTLGTYLIVEPDGSLSDKLVLANATIDGVAFATATLYSDPTLTPEPSTLAIFGFGAAALVALRLRRKSS